MSPCVGAVCAKMSASSFILLIMFSSCHWLWTSTKDGSEEFSALIWIFVIADLLTRDGRKSKCVINNFNDGLFGSDFWVWSSPKMTSVKPPPGSAPGSQTDPWFCLVLFGCHSFFSFSGGIDFCSTLLHNCSMKTKLTGSTPLLTGKLELLLINPQILTFSSCCFGPTSSPNLQDASFTLISDKENTYTSLSHQQVLLFTPVMSCCDTMSAMKSLFVSSSGAGSFSDAIATY